MHSTLRSPDRLLLVALGLGLAADRLFAGGQLGINAPLVVIGLLAALGLLARAEGLRPTAANLWAGAGALLFAGFLAVRAEETLTLLNLCAAGGLLLLLAASFRAEPLHQMSALQTLLRSIVAGVEIAFRPAPLVAGGVGRLAASSDRARSLMPVLRGLLLAAPVVLVFTGLLASADSVFAAYVDSVVSLNLPFDLAEALWHSFAVAALGWLFAGGLAVALLPSMVRREAEGGAEAELPAEGDTARLKAAAAPWRPLGFTEAATVLLAVDALFGSFMAIQGAYLFGGLDTLARTGMTYAEYARRGFFELLVVAILALGLLWGTALLARRDGAAQRRVFNAASGAMVALVLGLLASAFQRMWLYQGAYGFTHLRIYTLTFMVWLAVVLVLFLAALLSDRPRLFTFGGMVSALAYLAALNVVSPDSLIVRQNVAHPTPSGVLDTYYLTGLSADAAPALVEALPQLSDADRAVVLHELALQREEAQQAWEQAGWPAWHMARHAALRATSELPLPPAGAQPDPREIPDQDPELGQP